MTAGVTVDTWTKGWFANYSTSTGATLPYSEHLHTGFPFSAAVWCRHVSAGSSGREVFHTDTDTGTTNYWGWSVGALYSGGLNRDIFVLRYGNGSTTNRLLRGSSPPTLVADDWYHVVFSVSAHLTARHWINGIEYSESWSGTATGLAHDAAGTGRIGYDTRTSRAWTSGIADVRTWRRPITPAEVAELYQGGPGYCLVPPRRTTWRAFALTAGSTTGTAAVTLASATAAVSGTQTISGTLASTLAAATTSASGTQTYSGSAAATLAAATATATGSQTHSGTAAATTGPATSSASGTQTISGTSAVTLAAATCSASGTQGTGILGTVEVALASATAAATGSQAHSGTAAATTAPATTTASGTQTYAGSCFAGTGAASCSASGSQTFAGTSSSSLAAATATATGSVSGLPISGSVAVTLGAATVTASGSVVGIAGPAFAVEVVGRSLTLEAGGETIRVQAETPRTATTVR